MKLSRLRGRKSTERLLDDDFGQVWKGRTVVIRWMRGAPRNEDSSVHAIYVGSLASAKLSKSAIERNRMRRRCREALRSAVKDREKFPTVQLLLCPRSRSLDCDFGDIQRDIDTFLSMLLDAS